MSELEKRELWTRELERLVKNCPEGLKTQVVQYGNVQIGIKVADK